MSQSDVVEFEEPITPQNSKCSCSIEVLRGGIVVKGQNRKTPSFHVGCGGFIPQRVLRQLKKMP